MNAVAATIAITVAGVACLLVSGLAAVSFVTNKRTFKRLTVIVAYASLGLLLILYRHRAAAGVEQPGTYLLIIGDEKQAARLGAICSALPPDSLVAAVRLSSSADNEVIPNPVPASHCASGPAVVGQLPVTRRSWVEDITTAAKRYFVSGATTGGLLGFRALVVVMDQAAIWADLDVPAIVAGEPPWRSLGAERVRVFVVTPGRLGEGSLSIEPERMPIPSGRLIDVPDRLWIRMPGREGSSVCLSAQLDDQFQIPDQTYTLEPDRSGASRGIAQLSIASFAAGSPSALLDVGYHRVGVQAKEGACGLQNDRTTYSATRYLSVYRPRISIVDDVARGGGNVQTVGREAPNIAQFVQETFEREYKGAAGSRLRALLGGGGNGSTVRSVTGFGAALQSAGASVLTDDVLILNQPTAAELTSMDGVSPWMGRLTAGLDITVVGLPSSGTRVSNWPGPLAVPSQDGTPLIVHHGTKVLLYADDSRLARLPLALSNNPPHPTFTTLEHALFDSLYRGLGIGNSGLALADGFLRGTPRIEAAGTEVLFVPGSGLTMPAAQLYASDVGAGARGDVAVGSAWARLATWRDPEPIAGLKFGDYYTDTHAVVAVPDVPVLKSKAMVTIADLRAMGINVHVVAMRVPRSGDVSYGTFFDDTLGGQDSENFDAFANACSGNLPCPPQSVLPARFTKATSAGVLRTLEIGAGTTPSDARALGTQIAAEIRKSSFRPRVEVRQMARVFDPRTVRDSDAIAPPSAHQILDIDPLNQDQQYASVEMSNGRYAPLPIVSLTHVADGHIIEYGYPIFAPELWPASRTKNVSLLGFERLLDALAIGNRALEANTLGVRELRDNNTLSLLVPAADGASSQTSTVRIDNKAAVLTGYDAYSGRMSFQWRPETKTRGTVLLEVPGSEAKPVFINLSGVSGARTMPEYLAWVATYTHGDTLSSESVAGIAERLVERRPPALALSFVVIASVIVVLIPPVRSWSHLPVLFRQFTSERRRRYKDVHATSIETSLMAWGQQPGLPAGAKAAGVPAGFRLYERQDDLICAKLATLVPFTTLGRALGLPPTRPVIRYRQMTRAMEASILMDPSASLREPVSSHVRSKRDCVGAISRILGAWVWLQSGSLAACANGQVWGPSTSQDDADSLSRFLDDGVKVGSRKGLFPSASAGQTIYVLSDLASCDTQSLAKWASGAIEEGAAVSVIQLFDPAEAELVGLVWDSQMQAFHDRSEVSRTELIAAAGRLMGNAETLFTRVGATYLCCSTDATEDEMREQLLASGIVN